MRANTPSQSSVKLKYIKVTAEPAAPKAGKRRRLYKAEIEARVEEALSAAEEQLQRYLHDPPLSAVRGPGGWQVWSVAFVGVEAIHCRRPGQPTIVLRP